LKERGRGGESGGERGLNRIEYRYNFGGKKRNCQI